jgi:hypothetical protein
MRKFVVGFMLIMLAATVSGCILEPYGGGGGGRGEGGERGEHESHGDRR